MTAADDSPGTPPADAPPPPWLLTWPAAGAADVVVAVAPETWDAPAALAALLGPGERQRLAGFRHAERRARYLGGHALLHRVGRRFGLRIHVDRHADGRPLLTVDGRSLAASISHAGGLVAAAAGPVGHLGIDLEVPHPGARWTRIERRYGWAPLVDLDARTRRWSLWEATGKARGRGVFRGPDPVFEGLWSPDGPRARSGAWQSLAHPLPAGGWLLAVCDGPARGRATRLAGLP